MSELSKQALKVENNQSFPNNNAGLITPSALRTFNEDMIDSTVNQATYTTDSGSWNIRIGESVVTGSVSGSDLILVKENGASFSLTVPSAVLPSGVISGSSQVILQQTTGNLSGSRIDGAVTQSLTSISASHAETADVVGLFNNTITDGEFDQFLTTDGAGNLSFDWVKTLHQNIHNASGVTILKGTPLYVSGSTGDNANVYLADASNSNRRPAVLIAGDDSLAPNGTGTGLISGEIQGVDTNLYPAGTIVYLAVGGGWTATRPTGSDNLVQALGVVTRQASNGRGIIFNQIGNNLPNIQEGYAWVGDSTGVPVAVSTGSFGGGGASFPYVGDATITGSLFVSSSASSSIIVPNTFGVEGFVVDGNLRVQNGTLNVNQAINAGGIYLQTIGRNSNDPINVDNGLNIRPGAPGIAATDVSISGSLIVSQSISAELQQGYVWVGDSNNRTTQVSTGSFGGGGSTFPYTGDAEITGSLGVSNTVTSQIFLNPQTLTGTQTVPTGYNGMLTGPVSNAGTIVIESGANLVII